MSVLGKLRLGWGGVDAVEHAPSIYSDAMSFITISVLVMMLLATCIAYWQMDSAIERGSDVHLIRVAESIAVRLTHTAENSSGATLSLAVDFDGEISIVRSPNEPSILVGHVGAQIPSTRVCTSDTMLPQTIVVNGHLVRSLCRQVDAPAYGARPATIWLTETLEERRRTMPPILGAIVFAGVSLASAMLLIVYFGIRRGLRLLEPLSVYVPSDSEHSARARLTDGGSVPIEIAWLIHSRDQLARQLVTQTESENRFIANASHQLQNPLAGLLAQAETAATEPDLARVREHLRIIQESAQSVGRLITQLIGLAKLDDRDRLRAGFVAFDLRRVCKDVVERYLSTAQQKAIDLGWGGDCEVPDIFGNPYLMAELVANLVDNAIKYSPKGGQVTVSVGGGGNGRVHLTVDDSGPGLSPEDAARIFDRFVRLDTNDGAGCGLGLAIAHEIAALHDAVFQVRTKRSGLGGAAFSVFFGTLERRDVRT